MKSWCQPDENEYGEQCFRQRKQNHVCEIAMPMEQKGVFACIWRAGGGGLKSLKVLID